MKAHWPDDCNHGADTYLGTFTHNGIAHDVYVFTDKLARGPQVCIRCGRHSAYWSPGGLAGMRERMKCTPGFEPYRTALELIDAKEALKTSTALSKRPTSKRRRKERARIVP